MAHCDSAGPCVLTMSIQLKIITPERTVYDDNVDEVTMPTPQGEITILPHHIPLVTMLSTGVMTLRKSGVATYMASTGGFAEVLRDSKVRILADTADRAEELVTEEVERARERAAKMLAERRTDDVEGHAAALGALERELARLRAVRKRASAHHTRLSHPETDT